MAASSKTASDVSTRDRMRGLCAAVFPDALILAPLAVPVVRRTRGRGVEPDAVLVDRDAGRLILAADYGAGVVATDAVARRWRSKFSWWGGEILVVTVFGERAELAACGEMPAWGSMAWFASEPGHFIWFGDEASALQAL
jgi:hypothetical protein